MVDQPPEYPYVEPVPGSDRQFVVRVGPNEPDRVLDAGNGDLAVLSDRLKSVAQQMNLTTTALLDEIAQKKLKVHLP